MSHGEQLQLKQLLTLVQNGCWEPSFSGFPMKKGRLTEIHTGQPRCPFEYLLQRCPVMFLDDQLSYRLDDCSPFMLVLSCFTMAFTIQQLIL